MEDTHIKKIPRTQKRPVRGEKGQTIYKNIQTPVNKIALESPFLSVIMSNVSGLNSPIKRHKLSQWIKRSSYILSTRRR